MSLATAADRATDAVQALIQEASEAASDAVLRRDPHATRDLTDLGIACAAVMKMLAVIAASGHLDASPSSAHDTATPA